MSNERKTDADFVAILRDQIEYVRETDGEFCEVDPFGISLIVDELEELHRLRAILAAAPDFLPLARVAELHEDALTMGGCAEVNECDLAALTAEVLQARAARVDFTPDERSDLIDIFDEIKYEWGPRAVDALHKAYTAAGVKP